MKIASLGLSATMMGVLVLSACVLAGGYAFAQSPGSGEGVKAAPPAQMPWNVRVTLTPKDKKSPYPLKSLSPPPARRRASIKACMPVLSKELRQKWFHGEPHYLITVKAKGRHIVDVKPIKVKAHRGKEYAVGKLLGWIQLEKTRGKNRKKVYWQPPDEVKLAATRMAKCVRDQVRAWEWPKVEEGKGPYEIELKLQIKKLP